MARNHQRAEEGDVAAFLAKAVGRANAKNEKDTEAAVRDVISLPLANLPPVRNTSLAQLILTPRFIPPIPVAPPVSRNEPANQVRSSMRDLAEEFTRNVLNSRVPPTPVPAPDITAIPIPGPVRRVLIRTPKR